MAPALPHPLVLNRALPRALATASPSPLMALSSLIHLSRLSLLATSSLKLPCSGVGFPLSLSSGPLCFCWQHHLTESVGVM